jgi:hypothetical protein
MKFLRLIKDKKRVPTPIVRSMPLPLRRRLHLRRPKKINSNNRPVSQQEAKESNRKVQVTRNNDTKPNQPQV